MPDKRRKNKNKRRNKKNRSENVNSDNVISSSSNNVADKVTCETVIVNANVLVENTPVVDEKHVSQCSVQDSNNNLQNIEAQKPENEIEGQDYLVESPESSKKRTLPDKVKSKSLDDDEATKIVEISEESLNQSGDETLGLIDCSSIIVSDVESDVEWEKTDELDSDKDAKVCLATGTMSITAVPLNFARCDLTKSLTPEEEMSLRKYLNTLNLATGPENKNTVSTIEYKTEIEEIVDREIKHRLRKKGLAEDFLSHRVGPSRILDVIDEEGSSESSLSSRRHSHLIDKKTENDDLDDDVFEDKKPKKNEKFDSKMVGSRFVKKLPDRFPDPCLLVGAKLKDIDVNEARGDWSLQMVEKSAGAEVVYLTDTSSSTSSIYDAVSEDNETDAETESSVRMITPTIEVTDTESLLKKTFIAEKPIIKKEDLTSQNDKQILELSSSDESMPSLHEVVVTSTDDIKTNLFVKDISESATETLNQPQQEINIEKNVPDSKNNDMQALKSELNDAFYTLMKEVSNDISETNDKSAPLVRQDSSSSSIGSSQCTAKYNPSSSSLNDISNLLHEDARILQPNNNETNLTHIPSHVKDVFKCVAGSQHKSQVSNELPALRDLCLKKIATFPYGDKILEELAFVSKRLQNATVLNTFSNSYSKTETQSGFDEKTDTVKNNMPYYPLPDISSIDKVTFPAQNKAIAPPPIKPRNSSLKKTQDEGNWTALPTKSEPVYVCLSPSQKMLMEKTNTVITKEDASQLVDMHKKYVDRRGYNEYYSKGSNNASKNSDESPVIPFKSQTGSRLLALIRDPSVTNNIKPMKNHSMERLYKTFEETEKQISNTLRSFKDISNTFKPIPPPRSRKISSSYYESDESSEFTDSSLRSIKSEKKFFHFSTGHLDKEIENDVSSIQNMHRYKADRWNQPYDKPRRPSLPKDLCDQQMDYIRKKEKEVEAEINRLEEQKNKFVSVRKQFQAPLTKESETNLNNFKFKSTGNIFNQKEAKPSEKIEDKKFTSSQEELIRDKMYSEYVTQMAERQERKQKKIIKISNTADTTVNKSISKSMSAMDVLESKVNNRIEKEFICKARERWNKLGIRDPETEDERESVKDVYHEPKVIEHKIKVIQGGEERDVQKLPSHIREFVQFTAKDKDDGTDKSAIWRPGAPTPPPAPGPVPRSSAPPPPPPPPVWTPGSAAASPQAAKKNFRPVHFEETPPSRRKFGSSDQNGHTSGSESEGRLRTSQSAPATGLNSLGSPSGRLPKVQNPTVTLLQKAREGQIPRSSGFHQQESDRLPRDRPSPPDGDPVHALRKEYASESEDRSDHERFTRSVKMESHKKVEGIGPTTKDGMPVTLRSEVKDPSKWYKKMYDTIHKNKYDDDFVTIRYKSRGRGNQPQRASNKSQYAYFDPRSGYLSEPEGGASRAWSDDRPGSASLLSPYMPTDKYSTLASARASQEVYKNQPGRIEDYVPGKSSVVDKETKQWWDEVMDIFDGKNTSSTSLPQASPKERSNLTSNILSKSNMARALKESGYESDSTLVFRRRDTEAPLSPAEKRAAYRDLQAGGEPPLQGFRSPAPHRQENDNAPEPPRRAAVGSYSDTESPRRYVESDVNIHYKCPVRHDPLPLVPERELARQQAEHMKRLYREQKRNKYLQENEVRPEDIDAFDTYIKELQDMQNRRHQDNFTPSQKSVVPLNRYDEADKVVAKALYSFNGQTHRELSFKKGDVIRVRRQIDANWYEGEVHGRVGLFPYNYVELQKGDVTVTPQKPAVIEGRARAKFDFTAQTNLELPLKKGEIVVLSRRVDQNWWEGRSASKTGIFPDSYIEVLQLPSQSKTVPGVQPTHNQEKPVASPAAHGLLNGTAKKSMGTHSYMPQHNSQALSNAPPATQPLPGYVAKPAHSTLTPSERGYGPPTASGIDLNNTEPLYIDTNAEAIPYRAMYKYRPQNPDELELAEGDTVYVLEKCDDGWYVGSSQRTGRFGTFPGNYVERI